MAGPWDDYQSAEQAPAPGPWTQYQQATESTPVAPAPMVENSPLQPAEPITFAGRFMQGVKDPYNATAQMIDHAMPGASVMDRHIQEGERKYQDRRKASGNDGFDLARLVGSMLGAAPVMWAIPASAEGFFPALAAGTAQGAAVGSLQPVTDPSESFASQKVEQMGKSAALGGGTSALFNVAGRALAPTIDESVKMLRSRGVTPTAGQALGGGAAKTEEALTSVPGVGDFIKNAQRRAVEDLNRATYDEVLAPVYRQEAAAAGKATTAIPRYDGEVGHAGVRAIGDKLSKAYDDLVPHLALIPDEQLSADLTEAASAKSVMSEQAATQFDRILETRLPKGPLQGESLKRLESQLTHDIGQFGRSQDPNHQMISNALTDVRSAVLDNLARSNPAAADRLTAINQGWANLTRVERAAANSKDGVFSAEGLWNAVKAADTSVRKRSTARGTGGPMQDLANAGMKVLGRSYPDSGTPGRLLTSMLVGGAINPKLAIGAGLGSLPYTRLGQGAMASAILDRPDWALRIAPAVKSRDLPALFSAGLAAAVRPFAPRGTNSD